MLWYSLTGELSHSCPMLSFSCSQAHSSTNDPAECSRTGEILRWTLLWDAWMILSWTCPPILNWHSGFQPLSALPGVIIWHVCLNYNRRLSFVSWVINSIRNCTPSTGRHMCKLQRKKILLLSRMCFGGLNRWSFLTGMSHINKANDFQYHSKSFWSHPHRILMSNETVAEIFCLLVLN